MASEHVIRPLIPETFPAWLALAEKHNGLWGGCCRSYFHADTAETVKDDYDRATFKRRLVNEGVAHAALVFEGHTAIASCEYGSPEELPGITITSNTTPGKGIPPRGASHVSLSTATTVGPAWRMRLSRARCS